MARAGGAPAGSRYVDQRRYVVPASLANLRGPVSGVVTLDRWLDWSGDSSYDLDGAGDLQVGLRTPRDGVRYPPPMASKRSAALEAMIEEATVDAYNDDEQLTGLFTMIEENLSVPFTTTVLGVEVTVQEVDLTDDSIVAVCVRGRHRQRIDLLDLPLPTPPPDGAAWIDAYRHWAGR